MILSMSAMTSIKIRNACLQPSGARPELVLPAGKAASPVCNRALTFSADVFGSFRWGGRYDLSVS